jgi:hypothetical protein
VGLAELAASSQRADNGWPGVSLRHTKGEGRWRAAQDGRRRSLLAASGAAWARSATRATAGSAGRSVMPALPHFVGRQRAVVIGIEAIETFVQPRVLLLTGNDPGVAGVGPLEHGLRLGGIAGVRVDLVERHLALMLRIELVEPRLMAGAVLVPRYLAVLVGIATAMHFVAPRPVTLCTRAIAHALREQGGRCKHAKHYCCRESDTQPKSDVHPLLLFLGISRNRERFDGAA